MKALEFNQLGIATTTTKTGKDAYVYENDVNINRKYYQLIVGGKTIFTRGSLNKVFEKLEQL